MWRWIHHSANWVLLASVSGSTEWDEVYSALSLTLWLTKSFFFPTGSSQTSAETIRFSRWPHQTLTMFSRFIIILVISQSQSLPIIKLHILRHKNYYPMHGTQFVAPGIQYLDWHNCGSMEIPRVGKSSTLDLTSKGLSQLFWARYVRSTVNGLSTNSLQGATSWCKPVGVNK